VHLAPLLPAIADRPLVWVEEGIFSELQHPSLQPPTNLYRRTRQWVAYLRWWSLERWVWKRADVLVSVSIAEAAKIRRRVRAKIPVIVVPNGVDWRHFENVRSALGSPRGVFVASRWHPNVEALHFFADEVLPLIHRQLPDFRLVVAGDVRESRRLRHHLPRGVELVGFVDDLRSLFDRSGVFVAPILRGHGTRVKLLEAMAAGLPIVSTRKGAEGLPLVDGRDALLADAPADLADAVVQLIRDPERAARLGASALRLARERHDWSLAATALEQALRLAVEAGTRGEAADPRSSSTPSVPASGPH
jgi:glycosyltransferase involved in cell wall biosynthesis